MCILFVVNNPTPGPNGYKLILASNRDESYTRPAKPAGYWTDTPHILGGMDMEPGREGGTWLAMNTKTGKIGCLLNITVAEMSPDKRGRGNLVTDYINFNGTGEEYGQLIHKDGNEFNPFNLVMIDLLTDTDSLTFYSSVSPDGPLKFNKTDSAVYGFGNSFDHHTPFAKVKDGQSQLEKLVQVSGTTDQEEPLVAGLLDILKCEKRHLPDQQLQIQTSHFEEDFRTGLSSRFVYIPRAKYGTRTHTIILVDGENNAKFMEWTLAKPGSLPYEIKESWIQSKFEIHINNNDFKSNY